LENVDIIKGISSPYVYPQNVCQMHYVEILTAL